MDFFSCKSANNVATLTDRLGNVNWDELSEYKDPDCAYRCFLDTYTTLYNDYFPLKKVLKKECYSGQSSVDNLRDQMVRVARLSCGFFTAMAENKD